MGPYTPACTLITGATGGFGLAFARAFARAGSALVLHGRDPGKLDTVRAEFPEARTVCFDMADTPAMAAALAPLSDVDCLIANAGGAHGMDPAWEADLADWDAMIDANIRGLVHSVRHILPHMVARKKGHVITIGSVAGNWPYAHGNVYAASKAFVRQFALNLRADLHGTGVRVTNIEPGIAPTGFALTRFKGDRARAEAMYAHTRPLTAEDIARTALFAATLPEHVNINTLEVMPTDQSFGPLHIHRAPPDA